MSQLLAVLAGALLPVALAWVTTGAANGDPRWREIRRHQLVVVSAFPDCRNNLITIRGFYFEVPNFPIRVSLELQPLTVLDSDERFILAELPDTFCSNPGSYLLAVTRTKRERPEGSKSGGKSDS